MVDHVRSGAHDGSDRCRDLVGIGQHGRGRGRGCRARKRNIPVDAVLRHGATRPIPRRPRNRAGSVRADHGGSPTDIPIRAKCARCGLGHGKPTSFEWLPQFSISHSGDTVAVAFCVSGAVGLDVEPYGRFRLLADLRDQVISEEEQSRSSSQQHDDWPLTLWVRKEAALKCSGHGLSVRMTDVVTRGGRRGFEVEHSGLRYSGIEGTRGGNRFAVAVPGAVVPQVTHFRAL